MNFFKKDWESGFYEIQLWNRPSREVCHFKLVQSQQAFIYGDNAFTTTRHLLRQGSQVAGN